MTATTWTEQTLTATYWTDVAAVVQTYRLLWQTGSFLLWQAGSKLLFSVEP